MYMYIHINIYIDKYRVNPRVRANRSRTSATRRARWSQ